MTRGAVVLGQYQGDDNEGYTSGWDHDVLRYTHVPPMRDPVTSSDPLSGHGHQRFGSSHTSGINAVFADGSVRIIGFTVDPTAFRYMGEVQDGQVVRLD